MAGPIWGVRHPANLWPAVKHDFHQAKPGGVLELNAGKLALARGERQRQLLEKWKVDREVEELSMKIGQPVGGDDQFLG